MAGKHNEPVYSKSEADAVIAEKDKELRHHKYHRCLDKAKILEQEGMLIKYRLKSEEWLDKWHKKWLELAEKYKPSNSTAQ